VIVRLCRLMFRRKAQDTQGQNIKNHVVSDYSCGYDIGVLLDVDPDEMISNL
jgi:hypothetical protein